MIKYLAVFILSGLLFILFAGCEKMDHEDKYKRPDWLPGKLYTTVLTQKNLSLFAECIRISGLDTIIDVSGSWTVFAPTDEAIKQYLAENNYSSLTDIPQKELEKITKFHIIQNPWSLNQLKLLGLNGWRIAGDVNPNSYAYKRETILKNPDEKYWIKRVNKKEIIVGDSTMAERYKRVYTPSRKFVPIFYDKYLTINSLTAEDYNFYFKRAFEPGNVYYAGAKIMQADIFAENGFIHIVDKVVAPMMNAKERLETKLPGESYQLFLEMVNWYYPHFEPNMTATNSQAVIRLGGTADTLWDLNFAPLAFNLQKERFDNINQTLIKHNGLVAPTDAALKPFIDNVLTLKSGFPHWYDYKSLPPDVVDLIVGQNFKTAAFYPSKTQYQRIFKGANRYHQNEQDIIRKDFGSNSTFIGLSTYIPDRAFTSVTGPVFCRPVFSTFRKAMVYSGVYDAIANNRGQLYFFPISDYSLMADSSLILNWIDQDKNTFNFMAYNRSTHKLETINSTTLGNWILNQVGTSVSGAGTSREIIKTLGGNSLTWDHTNNTIQGTLPSTFGYKGTMTVTNNPFPLDEPTDNGKSLTVKYWFKFGN